MDLPIFPTQYSLLSADAINQKLQQAYGFTSSKCNLLIRNVSDTYLLTVSDEKYIFKVYRNSHRKHGEIVAEVELIDRLAKNGASVAAVVKDLNGESLQSFNAAEGTRYGVLFCFAQGKVAYEMTDQQLNLLGSEMAKLHGLTANLELTNQRNVYSLATTIVSPIEKLLPAFEQHDLLAQHQWLQKASARVLERFADFKLSIFSYGYCHFDFLPKNFHFDGDDQVTFFDFDFAGEGFLAWDVASFYIHPFLQVNYAQATREAADQSFATFLASYRKTKPFSQEEEAALPYLGFGFWVFYLGFQYESFEEWSNNFFGSKFLKERIALIKNWLEYTTGEDWTL